jgi:hypothetical protein
MPGRSLLVWTFPVLNQDEDSKLILGLEPLENFVLFY